MNIDTAQMLIIFFCVEKIKIQPFIHNELCFLKDCVCVLSWSVTCKLFVTPWIIAHLAPLFMGSSGQEYWSRLPFPPPGNLPNPGIKPVSPVSSALAGTLFITEPLGKPSELVVLYKRYYPLLPCSWSLQMCIDGYECLSFNFSLALGFS